MYLGICIYKQSRVHLNGKMECQETVALLIISADYTFRSTTYKVFYQQTYFQSPKLAI